jgi:hypothetical protein
MGRGLLFGCKEPHEPAGRGVCEMPLMVNFTLAAVSRSKISFPWGLGAHGCNPSYQEVETGRMAGQKVSETPSQV